MEDCIFCKIVKGQIPSSKVYEDDFVLAFNDIEPCAPVHVLIVPKKHFSDCVDATSSGIIERIFAAVKIISEKLELENGFRVVTNKGEDGGQTVSHLHFHLLGKRKLAWPPG